MLPGTLATPTLRVLALTPYPAQAAGPRFRLLQFVGPLAERGVELRTASMLQSQGFRHFYDRSRLFATVIALALTRYAHRHPGQVAPALWRRRCNFCNPACLS